MTLHEQPITLIVVLALLSILPLLAVLGTSFLKLAVVFSLLRNAIGIQQVPPNMAIYGLALILSLFIMAPVGMEISEHLQKKPVDWKSPQLFKQLDEDVLFPYRTFLEHHTDPKQFEFFSSIGKDIWPEKYHKLLSNKSILVLVPSFAVSQLIESFKIGLLLYLPFIAIDLIVSNILLAMGMMMVSPITIALPFKLLIFILIDGWQKLFKQLVLSYV